MLRTSNIAANHWMTATGAAGTIVLPDPEIRVKASAAARSHADAGEAPTCCLKVPQGPVVRTSPLIGCGWDAGEQEPRELMDDASNHALEVAK